MTTLKWKPSYPGGSLIQKSRNARYVAQYSSSGIENIIAGSAAASFVLLAPLIELPSPGSTLCVRLTLLRFPHLRQYLYPRQIVDLTGEEPVSSSLINPALGGGEEVRLCNPCVPDPNPHPLNYATVRPHGHRSTQSLSYTMLPLSARRSAIRPVSSSCHFLAGASG